MQPDRAPGDPSVGPGYDPGGPARRRPVGRPSPAVQDYLKAIYHLGEDPEGGEGLITTSQVAEALGVTPASASNMIRKLDGMGLAAQTKRQGVELTADGRQAALE